MKSALSTFSSVVKDIENKPGIFMAIPTSELKIDTEYQRPLTGRRVDDIANDWSWVACGVITVALRGTGSGNYYVIDGQHRVAGAIRAKITELPCIVFESNSHKEEAEGFLETNTARRPMSIVDRYRALLVVEDPIALHVAKLLKEAGREASMATSGGSSNATRISCIYTLMTCIRNDSDTLDRIWPLIISLCEDRLITKAILSGLFYIERHLTNTSITERHWNRRLMQIGYDAIHKSIQETVAFQGKAGNAIWADGILRAINSGLRNKFSIEIKTTESGKGE